MRALATLVGAAAYSQIMRLAIAVIACAGCVTTIASW